MKIPVEIRITPDEFVLLQELSKENDTSLQNVIRGLVKVCLADIQKEKDKKK